jgi:hypothetical protein
MIRPQFFARALVSAFLFAATAGAVARAADTMHGRHQGQFLTKACARRPRRGQDDDEGHGRCRQGERPEVPDSCHKDLENYVLTPNARDDFKKLEAAQKK